LVRFLWASKENEQKRESIAKRQAKNRTTFKKQYLISINVNAPAKLRNTALKSFKIQNLEFPLGH
jgi:hypothetical protein